MFRLSHRQLLVIGQIEPQRRHGNIASVHRPTVGALLNLLDWHDTDPESRTSKRILRGHDRTVVVPDRLSRPVHALGCSGWRIALDELQVRGRMQNGGN